MLKPQLARGELRTIGATTLDEYRKYIEKDAALERRFQPVMVDEPSVEDTIAILRGLKERYEVHHGVRIHGRGAGRGSRCSRIATSAIGFLPDKAVDLVDEAAVAFEDRARFDADGNRRDRARDHAARDGAAGAEEGKDPASKERLKKLEKELAGSERKSSALKAEWQKEKAVLEEQRKWKEQLDRARTELERAQRRGELAKGK